MTKSSTSEPQWDLPSLHPSQCPWNLECQPPVILEEFPAVQLTRCRLNAAGTDANAKQKEFPPVEQLPSNFSPTPKCDLPGIQMAPFEFTGYNGFISIIISPVWTEKHHWLTGGKISFWLLVHAQSISIDEAKALIGSPAELRSGLKRLELRELRVMQVEMKLRRVGTLAPSRQPLMKHQACERLPLPSGRLAAVHFNFTLGPESFIIPL